MTSAIEQSVTVGVLALQGDVDEHLIALAELGVTARPVRRPADLEGLHGIVLPGGESTTISKLLDVFEVRVPLQQLLDDGLPAYGSCAGMILLAGTVLDGREDQRSFGVLDATVRRNAFGRQVDSFETDLIVRGVRDEDRPVRAVFIRAPWVESVGDEVEVLAQVEGHPVAVRQGAVIATSFHPEVTGDRRVHELFVAEVVRRVTTGSGPAAPLLSRATDR